ncbi:MAG: DUF4384 domain-containing protein [Planctomycetota bacterium]
MTHRQRSALRVALFALALALAAGCSSSTAPGGHDGESNRRAPGDDRTAGNTATPASNADAGPAQVKPIERGDTGEWIRQLVERVTDEFTLSGHVAVLPLEQGGGITPESRYTAWQLCRQLGEHGVQIVGPELVDQLVERGYPRGKWRDARANGVMLGADVVLSGSLEQAVDGGAEVASVTLRCNAVGGANGTASEVSMPVNRLPDDSSLAEMRQALARHASEFRRRMESRLSLIIRMAVQDPAGIRYIESGDSAHSGDLVKFVWRTNVPAHVYLFMIDSDGRVSLVNRDAHGTAAGTARQFPVQPTKWLRLDNSIGVESFVALAARFELSPTVIDAVLADLRSASECSRTGQPWQPRQMAALARIRSPEQLFVASLDAFDRDASADLVGSAHVARRGAAEEQDDMLQIEPVAAGGLRVQRGRTRGFEEIADGGALTLEDTSGSPVAVLVSKVREAPEWVIESCWFRHVD